MTVVIRPEASSLPAGAAGGRVARVPAPIDLLVPFSAACGAAVKSALVGDWLDAALLVAGCGQVIEDHIHGSETLADRVAVHLTGDAAEPAGAARAADAVAAARRTAHRRRAEIRRLLAPRDALLELTMDLAAAAVGIGADADHDALAARVQAAVSVGAGWPASLDDVPLRLPSCFRSFDQHPVDMASLAARYAALHPDRTVPVTVAGIRTSGSYLGPFVAVALTELGFEKVTLVTLRAGERLDPNQAQAVQDARTRVVVVDDPPVSGGSIRDCVRTLEVAGAKRSRITLLLGMPDGAPVADVLSGLETVVLPASTWWVPGRLGAAPVAAMAAELLARSGRRLEGELEPAADPVGSAPGGAPRTPREHARAAYRARVVAADGTVQPALLLAQGIGVGLFGRHDEAVAARLGHLVPDVLGVSDGVLLQLVADVPAGERPALDAAAAAAYVLGRHRALPATVDRAAAMHGRKAAWEVAAMMVGGALGPADQLGRAAVLHSLVRDLLVVDEPSVIDGRMSVDRWLPAFRPGEPGRVELVKTEWADGAFSNRDLWSYDPVFDLAAVADELGRPAEVRAEWERLGGRPVEPARWLLHRLVHAWDQHRLGALPQPAFGRRIGDQLAEHVGEHFLAGLADATGPWCALDLDGVLETGVIHGGCAPGIAGGTALRALVAHGYRVIPATGRSIDEVAVRLRSWGLPAGVAEYGTAVVLPDDVLDLRSAEERAALDRVREFLAARPGVTVDPDYRYAVRAWRGPGRGPLSADDVRGARDAAGPVELTVVPGEDQNDLVPATASKGAGVRAALARLDPSRADLAKPLALAAGDGPADLGMLALAELAVVPAHAGDEIRAAATDAGRVRRSYQAGLAEGVGALLHHRPGSCPRCAVDLPPAEAALLTALSVREAGPAGIAPRLARLVRLAASGRH
jgi:hypothetical protein